MTESIYLEKVLSEASTVREQQLTVFALLNLGILDSLINGTISASDAIRVFFHADNCLYVRKSLHHPSAENIMSHGVQLPDLFDVLSPLEAQREFQRELSSMRALCLNILEEKRLTA